MKAIKRFVAAKAWNGYVIAPVGALANANTDAQIEAYVRANGATVFHATGTASMSPKGAKWGVVDPDLKVKGVEGLRIADGSILVSAIGCFIADRSHCCYLRYSHMPRMHILKDLSILSVNALLILSKVTSEF